MRPGLDYAVAAGALGLYALNRWVFSLDVVLPYDFAHYHLGDLCGGIAFPAYVNLLARAVRGSEIVTSLPSSLALSALCAVSWEVVAPALLPFSTGDIIDACMYAIGGLVYLACRTWDRSRRAGRRHPAEDAKDHAHVPNE